MLPQRLKPYRLWVVLALLPWTSGSGQSHEPLQARGILNVADANWCEHVSDTSASPQLYGDLEAVMMADPYLSEQLRREQDVRFLQVSGVLHSEHGSFLLRIPIHPSAGCHRLDIASATGTGSLEGITGSMESELLGEHVRYRLFYSLPASHRNGAR